jgi:hypothetical protein
LPGSGISSVLKASVPVETLRGDDQIALAASLVQLT